MAVSENRWEAGWLAEPRKPGVLVGNIMVRETERAVHVLNAVSPSTRDDPFFEELIENRFMKSHFVLRGGKT